MWQTVRFHHCLIIVAVAGLWPCLAQTANLNITGRITSKGQPVQGEIIVLDVARQLRLQSFRTDSIGNFAFDIVPGPRTIIVAKADGCVSEERELVPPQGGHAQLNFNLSGIGSVSGQVIDEAGAGVPAAVVRIRYPAQRRSYQFSDELGESVTDAFGNFTLPFVAEDRPFVIEAETADRPPSASRVLTLARATASGVVVTVGPTGHIIRGKIFNEEGAPAAGVTVRMRCLPPAGKPSTEERTSVGFLSRSNGRMTTRPDGAYEFRGVPAGRVIVVASRPGTKPVKGEGIASQGATLNIDLVLR